jgi:AbrB family looped-hinge helix DNA binding protein
MAEATLSSKNQIVIPREIREALQLEPGDKFILHIREKILIFEPKARHRAKPRTQKPTKKNQMRNRA